MSETSHPGAASTPIPTQPSPADLLEQLKAQLPESLFATVSGAMATYESELQHARLKIQVLEEKLRLQRIAKYGPGSEKLSNLQLALLELEPGVSNAEVNAESERSTPPPPADKNKKKPKHPGRQTLPANLARVEQVIACPPEQCTCASCGAVTTVIGYEVSEVLEVKPAEYYVHVTSARNGLARAVKSKE